tara:strand:- start:111 stop:449 length:339 start_codon:yes stop_codon:yes gene_type:complete
MLNYKFITWYIVGALVFILLIENMKKITEGMEVAVEEVAEEVSEVEPVEEVEAVEPVEDVASADGESGSLMDSLIDMAGNVFTFIVHILTLVLLIYIAMKVKGGNVKPTPPV